MNLNGHDFTELRELLRVPPGTIGLFTLSEPIIQTYQPKRRSKYVCAHYVDKRQAKCLSCKRELRRMKRGW